MGEGVTVSGIERMSGGASRQTFVFEAKSERDTRRLVLRRDPPGAPSPGLMRETALLRAAAARGVPVPRVVVSGDDSSPLGAAFLVMEHVDGETIPRRILRDEGLAPARAQLARRCGEVLAEIHSIEPAAVPGLSGGDQLEQLRNALDASAQPHPAFELAFRWLESDRPPPSDPTVVHGDFRNGNLIIGPEGIRAVLDWELAHLGDPAEDLGWLCMKAWRFGSSLPVGGFGTVEQLLAGYESHGGAHVEREVLRWWQVMGTLRWGIICIVQAATHTSGAVRSVELAALGRRVCEVEWDLLEMLR
jgi:aminoglycoside phosphotransferase (APT) family kinase protein